MSIEHFALDLCSTHAPLLCDTDNYFSSSLGGELATTSSANEYRHRFEDGRFIAYTFSNNSWIAYDKKGTKYTEVAPLVRTVFPLR